MSLRDVCNLIQHSPIGLGIRKSDWLFPTIESVHIIGLTMVIGSIMWLDFRLLGWGERSSVASVAQRVFPVTWWGFGTAVLTGSLLFASEAVMCYDNMAFRLKMLFLLLLGVNGLVYQYTTHKRVAEWEVERSTPLSAKMTGYASLILWTGVIIMGRWIAYVGAR